MKDILFIRPGDDSSAIQVAAWGQAVRQMAGNLQTDDLSGTQDRDPVERWGEARATLLGDAAHPMLQYLAQGACIALEDAVTLREALRACGRELEPAFRLYESKRVVRGARLIISAREMGRIYHAKGIERRVRNSLWAGRTPERPVLPAATQNREPRVSCLIGEKIWQDRWGR